MFVFESDEIKNATGAGMMKMMMIGEQAICRKTNRRELNSRKLNSRAYFLIFLIQFLEFLGCIFTIDDYSQLAHNYSGMCTVYLLFIVTYYTLLTVFCDFSYFQVLFSFQTVDFCLQLVQYIFIQIDFVLHFRFQIIS